eukprot:6215144-Prymnesium_polylepis.1
MMVDSGAAERDVIVDISLVPSTNVDGSALLTASPRVTILRDELQRLTSSLETHRMHDAAHLFTARPRLSRRNSSAASTVELGMPNAPPRSHNSTEASSVV